MPLSESASLILSSLLEARTGQQLASSRRWRIETALAPLMREHAFATLDQLIGAIASGRDPALADAAIEALLNNETSFFRDRGAFSSLFGPVLDRLERTHAKRKRLRLWCAGCSTGQEPYSLAMHFAEAPARWRGWAIEILASDVSRTAVAQAREGLYSQFEAQRGLSMGQLLRWFTQDGTHSWRIAPELRRAVRFDVANLVGPPRPVGRFDIILCRNLLLYFGPHTRWLALDRLAAASAPGAVLMLGAGETVIGQGDAFASDPAIPGLYALRDASEPRLLAAS